MKIKFIVINFICFFIVMLLTYSFFEYINSGSVKEIPDIVKSNIIPAVILGIFGVIAQFIGMKLIKKGITEK